MLAGNFKPVGFADLPGWQADDPAEAYSAFRRSALYARCNRYKSGTLGVDFDAFAEAFDAACRSGNVTSRQARQYFETHFLPCKIGAEEGKSGFVTGFYEPEAAASAVRTAEFSTPLMRQPDDLVKVTADNRPEGLDPAYAYACRRVDGLCEYPDRRAIESGALAGRGLEIAWLKDPVDAFFIHVQGAARLILEDGTMRRVTFAAKSGHGFSGPGKVLAGLGEIPPDEVTMQSIRRWFRLNPNRVREILWQNRSYIFFREAESDPHLGPIAAAKVPLTAGRSLAVDRKLHTFATPFYIDAPELTAFCGRPFARLMIAQDTGSAIVGPARGDIFSGCGDAAGEIAGVVRHPADFYALVPKRLVTGRDA